MARRKRIHEIAPDEIFLDATNLPSFDQGQFEGRIAKPLSKRTLTIFGGSVVFIFLALLMQSFMLQVVHGREYREQSEENRLAHTVIFAERGRILDRNDIPLAENTLVGSDPFLHRTYMSPGFSHLLGYVSYPGRDKNGNFFSYTIEGVAGIEKLFQEKLTGTNGVRLVETNAKGDIESEGTVRLAQKGSDIKLSIDARLQRALFDAIKERADLAPFEGGAAAVIDIHTGELVAFTSYPEYDSNVLASGEDHETIAQYQKDSRRPFLNRVYQGAYAPGSIVKPFVAYGALVDGIVSEERTFVSTGSITIPNPYTPSQPSIFRDWKAHGVVDMRKALAVSSDVYFYIIGGGYEGQRGLGIDRLNHWFRYFGFGEPVGILLPGEVPGVVPGREWKEETFGESWLLGNTYHTAIGQYGFTATLLQALRAVAALGNGGTLLTPTFLKSNETPVSGSLELDRQALQVIREGMRKAVEPGGTAQGLAMPYLHIAAKTGTAEVGATKSLVNSWTIGFFPEENPQYAFALVMEKGPRENLFGAVSVFRTSLDTLYRDHRDMFQNGSLVTH